jgi:UDPglucose--hexose-1-phosphate uridylyltransferase
MYSLELTKPDGRRLALYSRRPIASHLQAVSPSSTPLQANPHLRWHPLRGEWVAYASHRQDRTFLPPPEFNPLRPSSDLQQPTELPAGDYDIAVFDNLFPSMSLEARAAPASVTATAPGDGHCEVVVFTQDAQGALARLPIDHIALLLEVFALRTEQASRHPQIRYVLPFENRGAEVGVTLHHPHGQIYAYPFVPPIPHRMHDFERKHFQEHRRSLLESLIEAELQSGARVIYRGEHAVAFVPAWARYPYEVWIAPQRVTADFNSLRGAQREDLARAIKTALLKYDGLWNRPFPYIMAWYQAPLGEGAESGIHLHAECYPPYRMPGRLKYLAGTEIAAGMFASDALPEEKARELQAVPITLE